MRALLEAELVMRRLPAELWRRWREPASPETPDGVEVGTG